jgi:hypothetical protein
MVAGHARASRGQSQPWLRFGACLGALLDLGAFFADLVVMGASDPFFAPKQIIFSKDSR